MVSNDDFEECINDEEFNLINCSNVTKSNDIDESNEENVLFKSIGIVNVTKSNNAEFEFKLESLVLNSTAWSNVTNVIVEESVWAALFADSEAKDKGIRIRNK